jgi:hypothetical protein
MAVPDLKILSLVPSADDLSAHWEKRDDAPTDGRRSTTSFASGARWQRKRLALLLRCLLEQPGESTHDSELLEFVQELERD